MSHYMKLFLLFFPIVLAPGISSACPKDSDPVFFDLLQKIDEGGGGGDYETLWVGIDPSNGNCVTAKYFEKGRMIVSGLVRKDKCEGVRYLRKAFLSNVNLNYGSIVFENNENLILLILNSLYNDAYFQISAIEGDTYSRYKVAETMFGKLEEGYSVILGGNTGDFTATIKAYLSEAEAIPNLRQRSREILAKLRDKYTISSSSELIDTTPRKVICDPAYRN